MEHIPGSLSVGKKRQALSPRATEGKPRENESQRVHAGQLRNGEQTRQGGHVEEAQSQPGLSPRSSLVSTLWGRGDSKPDPSSLGSFTHAEKAVNVLVKEQVRQDRPKAKGRGPLGTLACQSLLLEYKEPPPRSLTAGTRRSPGLGCWCVCPPRTWGTYRLVSNLVGGD